MARSREIRTLRARMVDNGFDARAIAGKIMADYDRRPRAAWRLALGLSQAEAAERFNSRYGTATRAPMSATRLSAYERWPESGERPSPNTVCRLASLYGSRPADLIDDVDLTHVRASDREVFANLIKGETQAISPAAAAPSVPRRPEGYESDDSGDPEEVVMAAAHEGSEHAEAAERRDIGDATLEQLRADVVRLSRDYMDGVPFDTFRDMRRVRRRIYNALDRRLWPRDQTELYFLLGVLNGLMGLCAGDLGRLPVGEELVRAGWAYAIAIDHHPLMAYLRMEMATLSYWQQRRRQSQDLAQSGLRYTPDGPNAAQLHLFYGRAAARLGDADTARRAVIAAHESRQRDHHDELLEIGGEFDLTPATQHFKAGEVLAEVHGAEHEAITELELATRMYAAGPGSGEQYHQGCVAGSHVILARVLLRDAQLDAAVSTLAPVLSLSSEKRTSALLRGLNRVRTELSAPRYKGAPQATDLDQSIETYCNETIVSDIADLPG